MSKPNPNHGDKPETGAPDASRIKPGVRTVVPPALRTADRPQQTVVGRLQHLIINDRVTVGSHLAGEHVTITYDRCLVCGGPQRPKVVRIDHTTSSITITSTCPCDGAE